ncbi:MAG: radical SAM protein [Candidatus Omnitrophica bacterium]|nr:radical SAM protein [Candidatus Omnitrophota bacterium]
MISIARQNTPSEIVIEITGQCNMHCTYCTQTGRRLEHLPLTRIKNIIDHAKDLGVKAIRITGGEPLLVPHLTDILAYSKKNHLYTLLNTNATVITKEQARIIGQTVNNVLISLQGYNQASTQKLTASPGNFEEKINNVFLLKSYVPVLRLGTVITPALTDNFTRYASLIEKVKPDAWELFRPMTAPKTAQTIPANTYQKLALALLRLHKKRLRAVIGNAIPFCILTSRKTARLVFAGGRADDGHTRLIYDARGFFKPSYFIHENLGTDLAKAWRHPFLKKLNETAYLPVDCQCCEDLKDCCGGSRVAANRSAGTYFSHDPAMFKSSEKSLI